ncbi:MAG: AmmeMemoRadiSam system radical SAM enzyme [Chitinispirillia bacterium]|nr:AmmeMemoRadiSam system radical SAM enzyme [Chitinispirillia bacterium]MCL2241082.1 AmmeMemoRadiSam system radical SAM enzyme [Chitinispirillia bacterium]
MNDALLWSGNDDGSVVCGLCAHRCCIAPGKSGKCIVRANDGGVLRTRVYGRAIAEHVDPVEKKPLYHFLPASCTFSIAAPGCNFRCAFCQNWSISQAGGLRNSDGGLDACGRALPPQKAVEVAQKSGCDSISFTYTEPTVFFEYALDTAKAAKEAGLKTIFVSNGYMTKECLEMIGPYLDACNIDLKSGRDAFYKDLCGGSLQPVLDTLKSVRAMGIWLEVTTLVIGGCNDSGEELSAIAKFIRKELGEDVPWHVSKFVPQYRMAACPATDPAVIEKAVKTGLDAGLRYVYAGNVEMARDTICPGCKAPVITRHGYRTGRRGMEGGCCRKCGAKIDGVFS